ncbi:hypothetical protein CRM22_002923 [Opisthorchis felineus]|uniref:Cilia- and flagella-associated protein 45 n=1 Tax=Opisthorchis felineus TaxID=147828 RepID=A0A4S2M3P8_OPIFE|nr:hypothetical protein CRM22_002923 [Opisthorchis felineus]TGZ70914.1 hypothetical protein CRM22_002923 [Opisthorchis felineus]
MPSSSVHSVKSHATSHNTSRSLSSKKTKASNYRTIDKKSVVDEGLFGDPQRLKDRQNNRNNWSCGGEEQESEIIVSRPSLSKQECERERIFLKNKRIRHVASDLIRELIVPSDEPNAKSIILTKDKYDELTQKAKIITEADEKEAAKRAKELNEANAAASQARKEQMHQYDLARTKNEKLTDLEEEARKQAEVLLQKALEQRQDQEDEIRALNELILNAKIQAIRDEQILEKKQIQKELNEEELRLDNMMELERQNAIRIQEEIDKQRQEQEMLGACEVLNQIQQNRQDRLLELERTEQENALVQQRISEELMKEIANREVKRQMQNKMRMDLNEANEAMRKHREEEKERDRLFDLKILEIQRQKAEREAAYEAEQAQVRLEKELEIARLRALQERASDEAAERDALRAKRAAEAREREWRRKEKADALKKKETEDELKKARIAQAEERRRLLAIEAGRERMEFERILKRQKELMENDQRERAEANRKNKRYAEEIRKQICLKEQERIAERNAFFEEGVRLEEEARLRRMRLAEAKERKLRELREAGIPEKYLHQVERKVLHMGPAEKS